MNEGARNIATFELERELGRGGMGVVWLGRDRRLGRRVAVKMLRDTGDPLARERLLREARAAASISHPHVCQIYEVGEETGVLYVAMELLEGESLGQKLTGGALSLDESIPVLLEVLSALEVIHERGLVHRDVKPSNIFLTAYGAKLLDFGLARFGREDPDPEQMALTQPGTILGTPRYMAPEQWRGASVGPEADLWAVGVIFYEMLSGRPGFVGASVGEIYEAIVHREPPALSGGPAIVAADRVVQRALEKRPEHRFASAAAMSEAVEALRRPGATEPVRARQTTRLIVLPFPSLRSDPEIDFLSVSLPDAISAALASIDTLVVRSRLSSSAAAAGADIRTISREAGVDAVVSGTLLRSGQRVRVAAQLVEAPSGTVRWTETVEGALEDLFALQDSIVHQILASLTVTLSGPEEGRLERGAPADARAYELYLRGNELAVSWVQESRLLTARDLYRSCLDHDAGYAPAWARLARVYRVLSKYGYGNTEEYYRLGKEAIAKALELDPDLTVAHNYYTYFQVEEGEALPAMRRLIERARVRENDPDLWAGLVVALRFCGLLEASRAAHDRARRLDPAMRTGVAYTFFALGEFERAVETDDEVPGFCRFAGLDCLGRTEEAVEGLRAEVARKHEGLEANAIEMTLAAMERDRRRVRRSWDRLANSAFRDPEGRLLMTRNLARVGEVEIGLASLERIVADGFYCARMLETDPWFDALRSEPEYPELLDRARAGRDAAEAEFRRLGGGEILGTP